MKCEVDGQFKKFWLAYPQQWVEFFGHEIKVGKYSFCVGATSEGVLISETTTGMRVKTLPYNTLTDIMCATREGSLDYYETFILPMLKNAVSKNNMEDVLKQGRENVRKIGIGEMPSIEIADDSIIRVPSSDIIN